MRHFKITVNGNIYEVEVEELTSDESAPVNINQSEPVQTRTEPKKITAHGAQLKAPMPGTILKIPVKNGASVKKGDVIVVLEAMKLENDIYSPADGVVNLAVSQGATVNTGDLIAVIS
jgi:biotin carboxyl carrier protein